MKIRFALLLAFAIGLPAATLAQDARTILETAREKQLERWEGVDAYAVTQTLMGQTVTNYLTRTTVVDDNGNEETLFLTMPQSELEAGRCPEARSMTPAELEQMAAGMEMTGDAMAGEIESGMADAGLPPGLLRLGGSRPGESMDPRVMMGGNAAFMRAAAQGAREEQNRGAANEAQVRESALQMQAMMDSAKVVGTETVEGRSAWRIRTDGLDQVQEIDGGEFRMETMNMWIDQEHYVPLRMQIDGTATSGGETRPITMESTMTDYRSVPGSRMYEPYRTVMRVSGVMTPEQEAQMAQAQEQMAEMEAQMATMPESQRAMMENMMGSQFEMVRQMADGGGMRMETVVNSINVNPDLTTEDGTCSTAMLERGSGMMPAAATEGIGSRKVTDEDITVMIQRDLTRLGYDPGNTNGELTTQTVVAISRFQADNGLEVTGEPSPQLAGILASKVSGGGATPAAPAADPEALRAAQQACLQEKIAAAQEAQKKKRGFGRLMSGIGRAASRLGGGEFASDMAQTTRDIYDVNATASDLSAAAKDLGLTEDEIEACRNPN